MLRDLDYITEHELSRWVSSHLDSPEAQLSAGYQGKTLLFNENNNKLVIKVALGSFITRAINLALLRHEYRIYLQLQGMSAVPKCYGMVNNKYLVIEFIEGSTIRQNRPPSHSEFYNRLFDAINEMHHRQVAHFDLKRKENLLVTENNQPKIIDFGVSIHRKGSWHWLNHRLYNLAVKFDMNAWIRHKYDNKLASISQQDSRFYNKTALETYSKKIKRFYKDKIVAVFK